MAAYAIRAATLDDLAALTDIYNHSIVNSAITFDLQTFAPSERRGWFDDHSHAGPHRLLVGTDNRGRCVSPDGQRFLMMKPRASDAAVPPPSIVVFQHFDEELKRIVPTN